MPTKTFTERLIDFFAADYPVRVGVATEEWARFVGSCSACSVQTNKIWIVQVRQTVFRLCGKCRKELLHQMQTVK